MMRCYSLDYINAFIYPRISRAVGEGIRNEGYHYHKREIEGIYVYKAY